ncbi:unnamed protein product [Adineta steineri]|uniref:SH3 domain-containing protein n=1 Tax=Adineta steineri TaxID=433720 RepID=A0A814G1J7_9BILA|nr:unnamed protein product [Adineta steineri]CAF3545739.1 unnamed protein product [Adineta steineri]
MSWREALKKPIAKPTAPKPKFDAKDDDWETDINYENQTDEKAQRYGSTSVPGSGRIDHVDFKSIQEKVKTADSTVKEIYQGTNPNRGYGGKYGTDKVMDKSAVDFSYRTDLNKHSSQTDGNKGFGGAYGVDERPKDKSAVGFDYQAQVEKHPSQTDFSKGFGGKYGTDPNAQDKSAVGFAHKEAVPKHSSQKDYNVGFGGKYGIQKEEPSRLTTSATPPSERKVEEKPAPPVGSSIGVGNIRARFENMKKEQEEEAAKRVTEERNKRAVNEQQSTSNGNSNGHSKINHSEIPPAPQQPSVREASPPPSTHRSETPPPALPQISAPSVYENMAHKYEPQQSIPKYESQQPIPDYEKTEEPIKFIGNVNVASLLRQRKTSSPTHEDDDDDWAEDHPSYNQPQYEQRSPSPRSVVPSEQPSNNNHNEGIKCVARYSYQKTEEDELGFEENEIITNIQKMHEEWWFGKIGQRSGLFPSNYVEEI